MSSLSLTAIESARSRVALYRQQAGFATKDAGIPRMMSGGFPAYKQLAFGQTLMRHEEQYTHNQGWYYVVSNRIATRLASLKVKMGRKAETPSVATWTWDRPPRRKMSLLDRAMAPGYVKSLDLDMEMIENHPLLTALQNPNPIATSWDLLYSTVLSLLITGKSYWWFIERDDGKLDIYSVPTHWVTPIHTDYELNAKFCIRPSGQFGVEETVDGKDVCYFAMPDPSDPLGAISPLQTQAMAVAIDEMIQTSQFRFFKNGIFPGMKITAGRLPSMTGMGEGPRPFLTPEQRRELRDAVKAVYQGSVNFNEPLIVDALIENVERITQTAQEMDFIASANFNKSRLFQALGMNPYITGEVTGVNKAQAVVAEQNFATNVVGPLATMIGQKMSKHIGEDDVWFWLEQPAADDPDMKLRQWTAVLQYGVVKKGEYRQQVLGIPPAGDETDEEYITTPSGGGFGGGFGDAFGPPKEKPKPEMEGEKPAGEQGTPAEEVSGRDDRRVAIESGNTASGARDDGEGMPANASYRGGRRRRGR